MVTNDANAVVASDGRGWGARMAEATIGFQRRRRALRARVTHGASEGLSACLFLIYSCVRQVRSAWLSSSGASRGSM